MPPGSWDRGNETALGQTRSSRFTQRLLRGHRVMLAGAIPAALAKGPRGHLRVEAERVAKPESWSRASGQEVTRLQITTEKARALLLTTAPALYWDCAPSRLTHFCPMPETAIHNIWSPRLKKIMYLFKIIIIIFSDNAMPWVPFTSAHTDLLHYL